MEEAQVSYLSTSKEIFISTTPDTEVKLVYLINILGQTINLWNKTNFPSLSNEMRIPVNNVAEGSYIFKVVNSYGTISKKVIINQ